MKYTSFLPIMTILLLSSCATENSAPVRVTAFPGAEGFGAFSEGGRNGAVFTVTTLEDYAAGEDVIEGSLRQAVEAEGPRTVVFAIGGLIALKRSLTISNPYITIAGQTAPGDGICLKDHPLVIEADHVIVRYIRSRVGEDMHLELDAISVNRGENVIIDHCSASWSTDEVFSSYGELVTIQWCIISEGLMNSFHPKGPHSMGSIIEGKVGGISLLHNVYAHNNSRNPLIQNKGEEPGAVAEIRYNVIYDWGAMPGYTSWPGQARINYMDNYLKPGPSTHQEARQYAFRPYNKYTNIYLSDNYHAENTEGASDNRYLLWAADSVRDAVLLNAPYEMFPYQAKSPDSIFHSVLAGAGAVLPRRDAVDTRIVSDIRTRGGSIINSQNDVGGWPDYKSGEAPRDTDRDGMPDEWEQAHGLSPEDPSDRNGDTDGNGYTNLEEYLNGTGPDQPEKRLFPYSEYEKIIARKDALYQHDIKAVRQRVEEERQERANRVVPGYKAIVQEDGNRDMKLVVNDQKVLQLNYIPSGTFTMGSPENETGREDWELLHEVTLSRPFYMATVEMSNGLVRLLTGMKSYSENKQPVSMTWFDAEWLCEVLTRKTGKKFRLPTEAEWEYACRAGSSAPFFTGDDITLAYANFNTGDTTREIKPRPVDEGLPNAWGLKNMPGNQFEWCSDWKGKYGSGPVTDPAGPSREQSLRGFDRLYRKIMRGGNYGSTKEFMRSAYRYDYSRDVKYGFRIVMEQE